MHGVPAFQAFERRTIPVVPICVSAFAAHHVGSDLSGGVQSEVPATIRSDLVFDHLPELVGVPAQPVGGLKKLLERDEWVRVLCCDPCNVVRCDVVDMPHPPFFAPLARPHEVEPVRLLHPAPVVPEPCPHMVDLVPVPHPYLLHFAATDDDHRRQIDTAKIDPDEGFRHIVLNLGCGGHGGDKGVAFEIKLPDTPLLNRVDQVAVVFAVLHRQPYLLKAVANLLNRHNHIDAPVALHELP